MTARDRTHDSGKGALETSRRQLFGMVGTGLLSLLAIPGSAQSKTNTGSSRSQPINYVAVTPGRIDVLLRDDSEITELAFAANGGAQSTVFHPQEAEHRVPSIIMGGEMEVVTVFAYAGDTLVQKLIVPVGHYKDIMEEGDADPPVYHQPDRVALDSPDPV